jgi:hypothetical protein
LRADVSDGDVTDWLEEYGRAEMLGFWAEGGRVYATFMGWFGDKGQRMRSEYDPATNPKGSKRRTPRPPAELAHNLPELLAMQFPAREVDVSRQFPARENPTSRLLPAHAVPTAGAVPGAIKAARKRAEPKEPDPRHAPLRAELIADFQELRAEPYLWSYGKDDGLLAWLLKQATPEEIRARWRFAISADGWKQISTIGQLKTKWHDITAPERRGFDPNQGIMVSR